MRGSLVFLSLAPAMADASAALGKPSPLRRQPRQVRSQERVRRILEAAEALFVEGGASATTTNAIAARAGVPIGSLYQFFPDKGAILRRLAQGYGEQLHEQLTAFDQGEGQALPLEAYLRRIVELTDRFFRDHPGYPAIFMDAQSSTADLVAIEEEADARLIADWSGTLVQRAAAAGADLGEQDGRLIAYVLVKAIGNLLWLSATQEPASRSHLVRETAELAIGYLQRRIAAS
jgi:AcrR family transcriptional regulator